MRLGGSSGPWPPGLASPPPLKLALVLHTSVDVRPSIRMTREYSTAHPYLLPLKNTVVIILGGGRGTRLFPLTEGRSKPAVPLGGKYRIVDVPISNCIHSNLQKIFLLTQYQSASLNRHVNMAYKFDNFSKGFVEVMAAEQTEDSEEWFQGTSDAVRKQLRHFERWHPKYYLILSGDQLYRMDYRHLIAHHVNNQADVTVSVIPVNRRSASSFGLLHIDKSGRIVDFNEKPTDPKILDRYKLRSSTAVDMGLDGKKDLYLASMGIYLFNRKSMLEMLDDLKSSDFGKHVIPAAIKSHKVQSFVFDDYWEDIGTIRAYYEANIMLANRNSPFMVNDLIDPIYTNVRHLAPSRFYASTIDCSLIGDGSTIDHAEVLNSIIGVRSIIGKGAKIRNTVMIGSDHFDSPEIRSTFGRTAPPLGVGSNTVIDRAILDKNVRIGKDCRIINVNKLKEADDKHWHIREGIIILKKNAIIKNGTVI